MINIKFDIHIMYNDYKQSYDQNINSIKKSYEFQ